MAAFNVDEVTILGPLSEGGSAKIYKGRNNRTGMMYAVKIIDKTKIKSTILQYIVNEARLTMSLCHPHIIKTYYSTEDETYIKIYMELYTSDILDHILKYGNFEPVDIYIIFEQLTSAVHYLHNIKHIVHKDIKLDNILFNNSTDINVVLSDFGLSIRREPGDPLITSTAGTTEYAAPEILRGRPYKGYPADIYALGVCLFALVVGRLPARRENCYDIIEDTDLADLLTRMLDRNEDRRIDIRSIINHKWMTKMKLSLMSSSDDESENSETEDPEYYMYRKN